MNAMMNSGVRGIRILLFLAVMFGSSLAFADHTIALKAGNQAYNKGEYDNAIGHYVTAIQTTPEHPTAYRNLARAHFWKENYAAAVVYYDDYFLIVKEGDLDSIRDERKLAVERAGNQIYKTPKDQLMALRAFKKQMVDGVGYSKGGGGAYGLYRVLLRTGFASPELIEFKKQLARKVFDEFEAYLLPEPGQVAPTLDLEGWQLQAERINNARQLNRDKLFTERINQRSSAVEVALSLLTGTWNDTEKLLKVAISDNPDLKYLRWFEAIAHLKTDNKAAATTTISQLARVTKSDQPTMLDYVRVLRAIALQKNGKVNDASDVFLEILRR